jgi:hypothetical protein
MKTGGFTGSAGLQSNGSRSMTTRLIEKLAIYNHEQR